MARIVFLIAALVILGPSLASAGAREDVAAATQAWVAAVSNRDLEGVLALYDPEAVL